MNRFARTGDTADPCGVPLVRCASVPSACCSGAASHRLTYSSTHRSVQTAVSASTTRCHENGVEELPDVQVDHPVVLPTPCPACPDRVMGRLSRPIAIG